eukprot:scaffold84133_cov61-Attheya_sp.AAC.2
MAIVTKLTSVVGSQGVLKVNADTVVRSLGDDDVPVAYPGRTPKRERKNRETKKKCKVVNARENAL